ncbi:hypothetical protein OAE_15480 [Vibrio cyclitrophicus 1F289]|uniref:hypothetical protein n=1 Tax=Vibrio cyclitrophicus TaxID=47951 RepID=UPI0002EEFDDE|nr:hypothetical protein [Vibrio cyclitrophicus]OEF42270.1 hypothetical protein OAE_15480 [Vibrio cyclitrophicus 1F289]
MKGAHSNQATPKYLGYVYQVLIAIEKCFEATPNQTIWIECFGDVYDGNTFTEVKHHCEGHNLSSNSKDFWNTLKNLVVEDSEQFEEIVLHTTSTISSSSIFYDWNGASPQGRLEKIKDFTPCSTTEPLYRKILNDSTDDELLSIVSRFTINHSRMRVEEQWEQLLEMSKLRCLKESYRESVLHWVYSYVNQRAIEDRHYWRVNMNDFDDAFQYQVNRWGGDKIPFPDNNSQCVSNESNKFIFIDEYKDIGLRAVDRGVALNEYFQSKKSEESLIDLKPDIMPEIIEQYSIEVVSKARGYKSKASYDIDETDLGTKESQKASRDAYFDFCNSSILELPDVSDTKAYFMKGKAHEAINNQKYTWKFKLEDFD